MRLGNIERTLNALAQDEARRPQSLANTVEVARLRNEQDMEKTRRNPEIVIEEIEGEFQLFRGRIPEYERRIGEELRGKPETVERTLPYLLY